MLSWKIVFVFVLSKYSSLFAFRFRGPVPLAFQVFDYRLKESRSLLGTSSLSKNKRVTSCLCSKYFFMTGAMATFRVTLLLLYFTSARKEATPMIEYIYQFPEVILTKRVHECRICTWVYREAGGTSIGLGKDIHGDKAWPDFRSVETDVFLQFQRKLV